MRNPRFLTVPVIVLLGATSFTAGQSGGDTPQTPPAATEAVQKTPADLAFAPLQDEFVRMHTSLGNVGGISRTDKLIVRSFLDRIVAFTEKWPDHVGSTATALQISLWLYDQELITQWYERLSRLLPDRPEIALSWLAYREGRERGEELEAELYVEYQELFQRFPDDLAVVTGWTKRLMSQARYQEVLAILEPLDIDPGEWPELTFVFADCLLAAHQFEEADAKLTSIPLGGLRNPDMRQEILRRVQEFKAAPALWTAEQEIRAAEAEAGDLPLVEINTSRGRIVVELFENEAPNTVANFISLADSGFYAETKFHRYMPNFMIQGGDPFSKPGETGTPGLGNPGYTIPDEHTAENHRNHFNDSLAMAKTLPPNTAGCQFYLNHRPTPWLDGKHTVFGRVIEGQELARLLRKDDTIQSMVVVRRREGSTYEPRTLPLPTAPAAPPAIPGTP